MCTKGPVLAVLLCICISGTVTGCGSKGSPQNTIYELALELKAAKFDPGNLPCDARGPEFALYPLAKEVGPHAEPFFDSLDEARKCLIGSRIAYINHEVPLPEKRAAAHVVAVLCSRDGKTYALDSALVMHIIDAKKSVEEVSAWLGKPAAGLGSLHVPHTAVPTAACDEREDMTGSK